MNKKTLTALRRRNFTQYIAFMLGAPLALAGLAALSYVLLTRRIWHQNELLYQLLSFVRDYIIAFYMGGVIVCWVVITVYFMLRPYDYIDEILSATVGIISDPATQIELPPPLKEAQDRLNLLREASSRSAAAAREAEQRKNDLIVYLAHDLKTPLTSVIGYLTLLRDEPDITPELRARYTGIAADKAQRLEELINEFFDITRFNLSQVELSTERINLSRMLEQIAYEFRPILDKKNLSWKTDIQGGVEITADPDKLERVVDNLVRNAVSYSYPDTAIELSLAAGSKMAVVKLRNSCPNIPPEKLARIFDQFFRADSSRASNTGGTGLGLAIARQLAELHGGSLTAESEGESITFTLALPIDVRKP